MRSLDEGGALALIDELLREARWQPVPSWHVALPPRARARSRRAARRHRLRRSSGSAREDRNRYGQLLPPPGPAGQLRLLTAPSATRRGRALILVLDHESIASPCARRWPPRRSHDRHDVEQQLRRDLTDFIEYARSQYRLRARPARNIMKAFRRKPHVPSPRPPPAARKRTLRRGRRGWLAARAGVARDGRRVRARPALPAAAQLGRRPLHPRQPAAAGGVVASLRAIFGGAAVRGLPPAASAQLLARRAVGRRARAVRPARGQPAAVGRWRSTSGCARTPRSGFGVRQR